MFLQYIDMPPSLCVVFSIAHKKKTKASIIIPILLNQSIHNISRDPALVCDIAHYLSRIDQVQVS